MPALPPPVPPAQVAVEPAAAPALQALWEAFDLERPLPSSPRLSGPAARRYAWARAAATFDPEGPVPPNPYRSGPARLEVEAFRHLLAAPVSALQGALAALPLQEPGTPLALWRWGRRQVRSGRWPDAVRIAWEDRLLACDLPLARGYAFRHALCWALALGDESRFTAIRAHAPTQALELLPGLQRLFGLLGGPSPILRLWALPGLSYRDVTLDQLGAQRIWILPAPPAGPLPALPTDTAWIIPSESGLLDVREASLPQFLATEAAGLAARLPAAAPLVWFAPSRVAFESLGLDWFPILIDLDPRGGLARIRMGDAAPAQP